MLRLPKLLGDGCVLQQGYETRVWGWCGPGQRVRIMFENAGQESERLQRTEDMQETECLRRTIDVQEAECLQRTIDVQGTVKLHRTGSLREPENLQKTGAAQESQRMWEAEADGCGCFEAQLCELHPGGPFRLRVCNVDTGEQLVRRIYVGDVFVCGGQSNMELPMRRVRERFPEEFWEGGCSEVHLYKVQEHFDFCEELTDHVDAGWSDCRAEHLSEISAFSYFLGKELAGLRGIPIGIINLSLGGTPVEAWMSREGLAPWPEYLELRRIYQDATFRRELMKCKEAEEKAWYDEILRQEASFAVEEIRMKTNATVPETQDRAKAADEKYQSAIESLASESEVQLQTKGAAAGCQTEDRAVQDVCWTGGTAPVSEKQMRGKEAAADHTWHPITLPGRLADAGLVDFCGCVWLRRTFYVPDGCAGRAGVLRFGTLTDSDHIYINGVLVGETGYRYPPRRYPIPEGLLREGENEIQIRLVCRNGEGRATVGKPYEILWEDVCSGAYDGAAREKRNQRTEKPLAHEKHDREQRGALTQGKHSQEAEHALLYEKCEQSPECFSVYGMRDSDTDAIRKEKAPEILLSGEWEYQVRAVCGPAPEQEFINRRPTGLFQGMVAPCLPCRVKGVVWYQGESNDSRPENYGELLQGMIWDWRDRWQQEHLPFIIVQLPNCGVDIAEGDAWPQIREAQRHAGELEQVAMTVNIDIGEDNDLHPLDKKTAAHRAVLALRAIVYGEHTMWRGPVPAACQVKGNQVRISFEMEQGDQLLLAERESNLSQLAEPEVKTDLSQLAGPEPKTDLSQLPEPGLKINLPRLSEPESKNNIFQQTEREPQSSWQNKRLFEVAGADGIYYPARCVIQGQELYVSAPQVPDPCQVRYAWATAPGKVLLYSSNGLCASPFCLAIPAASQPPAGSTSECLYGK